MKTDFHNKVSALSLAFKRRLRWTSEMTHWVTFIYSEGAAVMPLMNDNFQSKLKMALQLGGISTENYSRHSFCRGGAKYAVMSTLN